MDSMFKSAKMNQMIDFRPYALILETGLRTGEMIGLTRNAIDWEKRTPAVNKALAFRHNRKDWRAA